MTIADQIDAIQTDIAAIKAAPAPTATVDLTAVNADIAAVKTAVDTILAKLTATPAA